ncbi:MAG: hypothetical protein HC802_19090 [Caldilineaceae bacterium]|nr:hypothetical protein [Caldilineaceae bacterium]
MGEVFEAELARLQGEETLNHDLEEGQRHKEKDKNTNDQQTHGQNWILSNEPQFLPAPPERRPVCFRYIRTHA